MRVLDHLVEIPTIALSSWSPARLSTMGGQRTIRPFEPIGQRSRRQRHQGAALYVLRAWCREGEGSEEGEEEIYAMRDVVSLTAVRNQEPD